MKLVLNIIILKLIFSCNMQLSLCVNINSIRVESKELVDITRDGGITVKADKNFVLRIFSDTPLDLTSEISFTNVKADANQNCNDLRRSEIFNVNSVYHNSALVSVKLSRSDAMLENLMICLRSNSTNFVWIHQGYEPWMVLHVVIENDYYNYVLTWVFSFLIPIFIILSALFSGLAMSLLTLTRSELKVLRNQGTSEEKKYSRAVAPLRKRGNLLFCTLLLMNTLTNVIVTVLFHELIRFYSILAATLLIVFLGELVPQTVCSRFGLSYGNKMAWLTNVFVIFAFPFSYPISKLMDSILDNEIPTVYNRDNLPEIICKHQPPIEVAKKDENDLRALKLSNKTVGDIMVKLEDAFMEEYNSVLTTEKVTEIIRKGYTRIPVYEKQRSNIVALLHLKDLCLIDPLDQLTIKTVCKFYNRPVNFVFEDTKLNVMLEEFKKGQSHMAFVQRVNNEGPGDPYYETLGMVTLEDVIDDIFHSDAATYKQPNNVFDPNIHFSNNELTTNMEKIKFNQFVVFQSTNQPNNVQGDANETDEWHNELTANMFIALKAFLPTLSPFKPEIISPAVLERLLQQSPIIKIKKSEMATDHVDYNSNKSSKAIVEKNKVLEEFLVVLQGKVEVEIGVEKFTFVEGPFSYFGLPVLLDALSKASNTLPSTLVPDSTLSTANENLSIKTVYSDYIPDFTVHAVTEEVEYLKIARTTYVSSIQVMMLKYLHDQSSINNVNCPLEMSRDPSYVFTNLTQAQQNGHEPHPFDYSNTVEFLSDIDKKSSNYLIGDCTFNKQIQMPTLSSQNYAYSHLKGNPKLGVWTPYQSCGLESKHRWDGDDNEYEEKHSDFPNNKKDYSGGNTENNSTVTEHEVKVWDVESNDNVDIEKNATDDIDIDRTKQRIL